MTRRFTIALAAILAATSATAQLPKAPPSVRDLPRRPAPPKATPTPTVELGAPIPASCDPQALAAVTTMLQGMGPARIPVYNCNEPLAICAAESKAITLEAEAQVERSRVSLLRLQRDLAYNCSAS